MEQVSPAKIVSEQTIRVSLFRLHPKADYEKELIDAFEDAIGKGNVISFKGVGHYDLICIYERSKPNNVLFHGAIKGIRSFSHIDCVCWGSDKAATIMEDLKKQNALAISLVSLHRSVLSENGGIRSDIINDAKRRKAKSLASVYYLNAFSWGEQVLFLSDNSISELWENSRDIELSMNKYCIDIHSVLGINIDPVIKWEADLDAVGGLIDPDFFLEWNISLTPKKNGLNDFRKCITQACRLIPSFRVTNVNSSFSNSEMCLRIHAKTWGEAITGIREIRRLAKDLFTTTKLRVLKKHRIQKPTSISDLPDQATEKPTELSFDECKKINKILDERVTRFVFQSIYSAIDASFDFPSCYVIDGIIRAERQLVELLKKMIDDKEFLQKRSIAEWNALIVEEAEYIIRATRQRLSGLPTTREFSRLAFEVPPPNVRIFIEACEFVIDAFLQKIGGKASPYVIVDTVDSPAHSYFTVFMPEDRLLDISTYIALPHESLHYFISFDLDFEKLKKTEKFQSYFNQGDTFSYITGQKERNRIIEEIIVELLDYQFSYLARYKDYMEEEWSFFSRHISHSLKHNFNVDDLIPYLLRTFVPKLWDIVHADAQKYKDTNYPAKPSYFIARPHKLRKELRNHIGYAITIGESYYNDLSEFRRVGALVVHLSNDLEMMADLLDKIFIEVRKRLAKKTTEIAEMTAIEKGEYKQIISDIADGIVVNRRLEFPHLIIKGVAKKQREKHGPDINNIANQKVTKALIMSMWNAYNISCSL